jgi:hypothetical protein
MVWESSDDHKTIDEALGALEEALGEILQQCR